MMKSNQQRRVARKADLANEAEKKEKGKGKALFFSNFEIWPRRLQVHRQVRNIIVHKLKLTASMVPSTTIDIQLILWSSKVI